MRRNVGIVIFAIGVVLLLTHSVLKVYELGRGVGILGCILGAIIFGLSFIPQPEVGPDAPPPLSPADRVLRVFYEPAPVFTNLRYHPRWLAGFLVIVFFSVSYQLAFTQRVTSERIATETMDRLIESGWIPADQVDEIREATMQDAKSTISRVTGLVRQAGGILIFFLILASIYLLCIMAFGGRINFWGALSVAFYGSLPAAVISTVLNVIVLYTKPAEDIDIFKASRGLARADLGILFAPADHPLLFVIGSFIGVFTLYGWWVTVSGFRNTATKISNGSAWTIAFLLWLLGLILVLILAAMFPQFVR